MANHLKLLNFCVEGRCAPGLGRCRRKPLGRKSGCGASSSVAPFRADRAALSGRQDIRPAPISTEPAEMARPCAVAHSALLTKGRLAKPFSGLIFGLSVDISSGLL